MRQLLIFVLLSLAACTQTEIQAGPRVYAASFLLSEPGMTIDGDLSDPAWQNAPWSDDYIDIEGSKHPAPRFRTRMKMTWDDAYLYIGAEMEEPDIWATLTERDSVIFYDNDFEVFLDPDGDCENYMELEINAFGTEWDLFLPKSYINGGEPDNSWDIEGLRVGIQIDGSLNDSSDVDKGWAIEIAIPMSAIAPNTDLQVPPSDGDRWRINFSRVEWEVVRDGASSSGYRKIEGREADNWVWSPQHVINMHLPQHWGIIEFIGRRRPETLQLRKADLRPCPLSVAPRDYTGYSSRIRKHMRLFVGNLPWSIDDDELRNIFAEYGDVSDSKIIQDRETGRSRGFGFIELDDEGATKAIEALNGTEFEGRAIKVNEAQAREERPRRW